MLGVPSAFDRSGGECVRRYLCVPGRVLCIAPGRRHPRRSCKIPVLGVHELRIIFPGQYVGGELRLQRRLLRVSGIRGFVHGVRARHIHPVHGRDEGFGVPCVPFIFDVSGGECGCCGLCVPGRVFWCSVDGQQLHRLSCEHVQQLHQSDGHFVVRFLPVLIHLSCRQCGVVSVHLQCRILREISIRGLLCLPCGYVQFTIKPNYQFKLRSLPSILVKPRGQLVRWPVHLQRRIVWKNEYKLHAVCAGYLRTQQ